MRARRRAAILVVGAAIGLVPSSVRESHADTGIRTAITIHAERYKFVPSDITLKQGQKVKLTFISDDVPHGIAVTDLGISSNFSKAHPSQIVITPDKSGTFEGECSRYCGSGHGKMKLEIHVIP